MFIDVNTYFFINTQAAIVELIRRSPIPDLDIDFFMDDSGNWLGLCMYV
jgi:hypothetical protein